jgi:hypothetical protein
VAYDIGTRAAMEDMFMALPHADALFDLACGQTTFAAVYDGHVGRLAGIV